MNTVGICVPRVHAMTESPDTGSDSESDTTFRERLHKYFKADPDLTEQTGPEHPGPEHPLPVPNAIKPFLWRRICRWYLQGAPAIFLQMILRYIVQTEYSLQYCDVNFLELFAGVASMTSSFDFYGYAAQSFEVKHDNVYQNILGRRGFLMAGTLLYRLTVVSAAMFAPVCSTWTFLARHKTLRSAAFPLGFSGHNPLFGPCCEQVTSPELSVNRLPALLSFVCVRMCQSRLRALCVRVCVCVCVCLRWSLYGQACVA